MFKRYYLLTKPGIIRGNLMTAGAGFLLASNRHIDIWLLIAVLAGTSLIIASGCVFNNYLDREIDRKMLRTKKRALVTGEVPVKNALIYGTVLGLIGFVTLYMYTNLLTTLLGAIGFVAYVVVYGYFKRNSVHGTLVGSISGAIPPVAGYAAVTNQLDGGALGLFLILTFWQMPHFYSIAMYRLKDYKAAGIPVLPAKKGFRATKLQILIYIVAFIAATTILTIFDYTGYTYLFIVVAFSLAWLRLGLNGFNDEDDERWAHKMFGFSLLVLLVFSLMISVSTYLP